MKIEKYNNVIFLYISSENVDQRIDNFLRTYLKNVPKSRIYRIIRNGEVRVNKKRIKPSYKLKENDIIRIPPNISINKNKSILDINNNKIIKFIPEIIYEDNYLLAINKLSGTAVHGGSNLSFGIIEVIRALRTKICFLELVHRLDRNTSGILLIAKKRSTLCELHAQLRTHRIKKTYLALVYGYWPKHLTVINQPLLKKYIHGKGKIVSVNTSGKQSETYITIKERFKNATLLNVYPITGRTHQIRVHMSYVGFPVIFDDRYGNKDINNQFQSLGLKRLFLHASNITFTHPKSKKVICLKVPLEKELKKLLDKLRKQNTIS